MAVLSSVERLRSELAQLPVEAARHVWLEPTMGLVVGNFPEATHSFDFASEQLVRIVPSSTQTKRVVSLLSKAGRVRTISRIETPDAIYEVGSATQMLVEGLNIVERMRPGTIERFAQVKGRTKRAVARFREDLYDYPHPPSHSAKLENGFYVATNNKAHGAMSYLRQAIRIAGLEREITLHV